MVASCASSPLLTLSAQTRLAFGSSLSGGGPSSGPAGGGAGTVARLNAFMQKTQPAADVARAEEAVVGTSKSRSSRRRRRNPASASLAALGVEDRMTKKAEEQAAKVRIRFHLDCSWPSWPFVS